MDNDKVTLQDMIAEAPLFRSVYADLLSEIKRGEQSHGRLNEFQLMQAVAHAKNGLGVLSFERRRTINAIFEAFTEFYRSEGRQAAELWAAETFGCSAVGVNWISDDMSDIAARVEELSLQIQEHEARLLPLYREYHMLQTCLESGDRPGASREEQD